jgi:hypothetical protein
MSTLEIIETLSEIVRIQAEIICGQVKQLEQLNAVSQYEDKIKWANDMMQYYFGND